MPRDKERLKRSHNGLEIGFANSFNILLFILSGPEDFPSLSVCNTDLTSSFVIVILLSGSLSGRRRVGSVAPVSSKIV